MLTTEEMTSLILQTDRAKSDAAVDAMSEEDAKKMLKRMLATVHRLSKEGYTKIEIPPFLVRE